MCFVSLMLHFHLKMMVFKTPIQFSQCLKVMLHRRFGTTIFSAIYATLQHYCNIVSNNCNIVPTLQRCVLLKIVVENRPL